MASIKNFEDSKAWKAAKAEQRHKGTKAQRITVDH